MRLIFEEVSSCHLCPYFHQECSNTYPGQRCAHKDCDKQGEWGDWWIHAQYGRESSIWPGCPLPKVTEGPREYELDSI
jgi:hypothetical protein